MPTTLAGQISTLMKSYAIHGPLIEATRNHNIIVNGNFETWEMPLRESTCPQPRPSSQPERKTCQFCGMGTYCVELRNIHVHRYFHTFSIISCSQCCNRIMRGLEDNNIKVETDRRQNWHLRITGHDRITQ